MTRSPTTKAGLPDWPGAALHGHYRCPDLHGRASEKRESRLFPNDFGFSGVSGSMQSGERGRSVAENGIVEIRNLIGEVDRRGPSSILSARRGILKSNGKPLLGGLTI